MIIGPVEKDVRIDKSVAIINQALERSKDATGRYDHSFALAILAGDILRLEQRIAELTPRENPVVVQWDPDPLAAAVPPDSEA